MLRQPSNSRDSSYGTSPVFPLWLRIAFPLCAAGLAVLMFSCDLTVARYIQENRPPGFLRELVENTEPFGHGIGVVILLATMAISHRERWRNYVHTGAIALGAGLITDLFKASYGRIRPRDLPWDQVASVQDTFLGWFPLLNGLDSHTSFPSGHTTVAFALAVCLSVLFPKGRNMFLGLAAFVACGRVLTSAHYLSDVCMGAAVGWTVAQTAIYAGRKNALVRLVRETKSSPVESTPSVSLNPSAAAADSSRQAA